jgi:hypothetical protein
MISSTAFICSTCCGEKVGAAVKDGVTVKVMMGGGVAVTVGAAQAVSKNKIIMMIKIDRMDYLRFGIESLYTCEQGNGIEIIPHGDEA